MFSDEMSSYNENINAGTVQTTWVNLLLSWVNKCTEPEQEVRQLSVAVLAEALNHYLSDVCAGDGPFAADDLEPFLCRYFNILRLKQLRDFTDLPKKVYIMSSAVLYFCCVHSAGRVASDVCARLQPAHQLMVLVFCERLAEMEVTVSNMEMAIRDACESVEKYEENSDGPVLSRLLSATTIGTTSDFSGQSHKERIAALKSLRSSVIAMQTRVVASSSGSYQERATTSSVSGSVSNLLTNDEVLSESGEIIMPNKQSGDSKVSDTENVDAKTDEVFAEEKHLKTANERLLLECDNTGITDMAVSVQVRKDKNLPFKDVVRQQDSPQDLIAFKRFGSLNPSRFRNALSTRINYNFHTRVFRHPRHRDPGESKGSRLWKFTMLSCCCILVIILFVLSLSSYLLFFLNHNEKSSNDTDNSVKIVYRLKMEDNTRKNDRFGGQQKWMWECKHSVCQKVKRIEHKPNCYSSSSRCTLVCIGPQILPFPTERVHYGKSLVALSSKYLQYTVQSAPSDKVKNYLAQAFGFFYEDVVKLENVGRKSLNYTLDLPLKIMNIRMSVDHDADPRMRLNTDEAYLIEIGTDGNQLMVYLSAGTFCGVRHGLETLSKMIMSDESTGYLIGLSSAVVKDSPNYSYRGLMLDTARNYIPIPDIIRTIDAMASCKLNTFHWRITDATSFPLLLPQFSDLFKWGAYDRSMVYTKQDVRTVVERAAVRGVRVLLEAALPGPVGPAWGWSRDASCTRSCHPLCLRLNVQESLFDVLQYLYSEILEMTSVNDIFHLSDGVFSLTNCYFLLEDRKGFLSKALDTLRLANQGVLPALPIIWYTSQAAEETAWGRLGVQVHQWREDVTERRLRRYRVVQSTKWDLSCEMKNHRCYRYSTWQEMYQWRSWRAIDALNIEGGEAMLWTDLINSGNLDMHLWPRAAVVAERLWADEALSSAPSDPVYIRLDHHLSRLSLRGVSVPPLWPPPCRAAPRACLDALRDAQSPAR